MGSASEVQRLDGLALHDLFFAVPCQAVANNRDLTLTFKVGHNRLGAP